MSISTNKTMHSPCFSAGKPQVPYLIKKAATGQDGLRTALSRQKTLRNDRPQQMESFDIDWSLAESLQRLYLRHNPDNFEKDIKGSPV